MAVATHSSTVAWKIPWMEGPGRLQSMGSRRLRHDWGLHFHFSLSCIGEGNGNPLQCSCLENPRDRGAWWAAICGVSQSWTWLKRLSGSSSNNYFKTLWWFLRYIHMNQPWVPHPDPPSNLPPHLITQSHPSAPALSTLSHASNLGRQSISHMMLFSQIIPPSPSPTESKRLWFTSVSLLLSLM